MWTKARSRTFEVHTQNPICFVFSEPSNGFLASTQVGATLNQLTPVGSPRCQFGETTYHIFARKKCKHVGETRNHLPIFARKINANMLLPWSTSSFHSAGFDFLLVEEQTPYDLLQTARPPQVTGLALDKVRWFNCCPRLNYHRCGKWMKWRVYGLLVKKWWFSTSVLVCLRVNMVRFHGYVKFDQRVTRGTSQRFLRLAAWPSLALVILVQEKIEQT